MRDQRSFVFVFLLLFLVMYWFLGETRGYDSDADLPPKEWWMG